MTWTGDPIWLAEALRAEGLTVIEHEGWRDRGHGDFGDIRGIICHHTAGGGPTDWKVVQYGRPDLPGPLSQLVLERDGTYRVIAAGVAWHAGRGSWPGWPTNNANFHTIGIEAVNNGVGQPWPAVQIDAYVRGCAALARRARIDERGIAAHREYSSEGKIDPTGIDMHWFRREVKARLDGGGANPAPGQAGAVFLSIGDRGPNVLVLQHRLKRAYSKLPVDGVFGDHTMRCVLDYQRLKGLEVDGIVGPKTAASLKITLTAEAA